MKQKIHGEIDGDETVKCIAFLEICPEVMDRAIETDRKRVSSGRAVKTLFPPHMIAKTSTGFLEFVIFESEDEAEIVEYVAAYARVGVKMRSTQFLRLLRLLKSGKN